MVSKDQNHPLSTVVHFLQLLPEEWMMRKLWLNSLLSHLLMTSSRYQKISCNTSEDQRHLLQGGNQLESSRGRSSFWIISEQRGGKKKKKSYRMLISNITLPSCYPNAFFAPQKILVTEHKDHGYIQLIYHSQSLLSYSASLWTLNTIWEVRSSPAYTYLIWLTWSLVSPNRDPPDLTALSYSTLFCSDSPSIFAHEKGIYSE